MTFTQSHTGMSPREQWISSQNLYTNQQHTFLADYGAKTLLNAVDLVATL